MSSLLPFRDINVHASASHYAFTSPSTPSAPTLVIERPSGDLRLNDGPLLGTKRVSSIAGILGIIKLKLGMNKYVIVITKAQPMGRIKGHMVYKVIATEFLPLRERPLDDPDENTYRTLLKTLLKTGPMYFSYSCDLTNSFQRQAQSNLSSPLWKRADDRFFWNRFIQTDLIDFRTRGSGSSPMRPTGREQTGVDGFILPVMFGMMEITNTSIKTTPITFVLITRRSRFRAGVRFMSRGLDDQGHVSNFNETEQIVILNDSNESLGGFAGGGDSRSGRVGVSDRREVQIMSYVQTRGSIPVFWAELSTLRYAPTLQVRSVETAIDAARKHFDEQIRLYGENYLVNLVNQKGREEPVKKAYEQMVRILVSSPKDQISSDDYSSEKKHLVEPTQRNQQYDRLHYIYFDFHNETKGLQWHRAQILLDQLKQGLTQGGYFRAADMPGDTQGRLEVRYQQTAVVRTNCMDCLDRTNVVQSMIARWTLTRQLVDAGILRLGESQEDDPAFRNLFRNIWADNADVVSKSYSGTGALKTDFTRTGQRTRAGAFQDFKYSATRYTLGSVADGPRQDAFDLFHGVHLPSAHIGGARIFADQRPVFIQSIPYLLATSCFMIMVSLFSRRLPNSTIWPLRLFVLFWFAVSAWCLHFIFTHGPLYVNWPKLNTPRFAVDGYQQAMGNVRQDKMLGQFVIRHERGASNARLGHLEEGKKRIQ